MGHAGSRKSEAVDLESTAVGSSTPSQVRRHRRKLATEKGETDHDNRHLGAKTEDLEKQVDVLTKALDPLKSDFGKMQLQMKRASKDREKERQGSIQALKQECEGAKFEIANMRVQMKRAGEDREADLLEVW